MPLWTNANADLLIQHPALSQEWVASNLTLPDAQYSAEFARFINRTGLGYLPHRTDTDRRCFKIANRKSAYGGVLVSELGFLTPLGQEYYSDIKRIYQLLTLNMQETGEKLPNPTDSAVLDQTTQMDRLILKGVLSPRAMKYLRIMAGLTKGPINADVAVLPGNGTPMLLDDDLYENVISYQGEQVLTTAFMRTRPNERMAFEQLVKFGLVDLLSLPKDPEKRNRGRNPIAAKITAIGAKFYALWEQKFDPLIQQERTWQAELSDDLDAPQPQYPMLTRPKPNQDQ